MSFSDLLADLDASVDEHLRDPAILRPIGGGPDVLIRVEIEYPQETETISRAAVVQSKPWLHLNVRLAPQLVKGDKILVGRSAPYQGWRVAASPLRPDDGWNWFAQLEPIGIVTE